MFTENNKRLTSSFLVNHITILLFLKISSKKQLHRTDLLPAPDTVQHFAIVCGNRLGRSSTLNLASLNTVCELRLFCLTQELIDQVQISQSAAAATQCTDFLLTWVQARYPHYWLVRIKRDCKFRIISKVSSGPPAVKSNKSWTLLKATD